MKHILLQTCLVVFLLLSFFLLSCSESTDPMRGSVTGKVILIDDSGVNGSLIRDSAGVTIAIYKETIVDTTVSRINQSYPQIGVQVSQYSEFDHRNSQPVGYTVSGADGTFIIEDIEQGTYNLVCVRNGWSLKYLFQVEVTDENVTEIGNIEMYPVITVQGFIDSPIVFRSGRQYIVTGNTDVVSDVVFENSTQVCIDPNIDLDFFGSVVFNEATDSSSYWKITSSFGLDSIYQTPPDQTYFAGSVVFRQSLLNIRDGIVSRVRNGVNIFSSSCFVSDMILVNLQNGIYVQNSSLSVSNISACNVSEIALEVISNSVLATISNSIFLNSGSAIVSNTTGQYEVSNNYIQANDFGIQAFSNYGQITNNCFNGNNIDIFMGYASGTISKNKFFNSVSRTIKLNGIAPVVNNNDFYLTGGYFVNIRSNPPTYCSINSDMDATNNYWKLSNYEDFIMDAADNVSYPGQECLYYVDTIPKRNTPVAGAGIRQTHKEALLTQ